MLGLLLVFLLVWVCNHMLVWVYNHRMVWVCIHIYWVQQRVWGLGSSQCCRELVLNSQCYKELAIVHMVLVLGSCWCYMESAVVRMELGLDNYRYCGSRGGKSEFGHDSSSDQ